VRHDTRGVDGGGEDDARRLEHAAAAATRSRRRMRPGVMARGGEVRDPAKRARWW
jgi:hypothetical protein